MGNDQPGLPEEAELITSALKDLQSYLLSDALYGNIAIPVKQRLTPGNLLLWFRNTSAFSDQPKLETELHKLKDQFELIKNRWLSAWQKKAAREYMNRSNRWQDYLEDMENGERSMAIYSYQVRHRVILDLLIREISTGMNHSLVDALDRRLEEYSKPDVFIWHPKLEGEFPVDTYWYLYRKLIPV